MLYWRFSRCTVRESPTEPYGWVKRVGMLISVPLILGLSPVIGCAMGWAIDRALGTRPVFTILLLAAGFAAGVRETWTLIRRATSENDRKNS